jgi:hypothetical protein
LIFYIKLSEREIKGFSKDSGSRGSPWLPSLLLAGRKMCGQSWETLSRAHLRWLAMASYLTIPEQVWKIRSKNKDFTSM